jgi:polyhydroxybutyrate depolymerase
MVLALHGALGSAAQFDESTGLVAEATERGFAIAMPDAVEGSWDYGMEGPDDAFLTGIVEATAESHCIDLHRVHVVGMSLGAWKSAITACANPGTFASAVLVTVEVHPEGCEPLPVIAIHGTADVMAPYGEGGDDVEIISSLGALSGTRDNVAAWAEGAGCDPTWEESRIEPDVVHWVYEGCDDGLGVELYTIEGGNHAWPGSDAERMLTTEAIDATEVTLDWFEQHSR